MSKRLALSFALALAGALPTHAATVSGGFAIEVLVDGQPVREYPARGTRYVEAVHGKEYAIRIRNPLGVRVAVALSVDGLNTIDAKRTSASAARKWVLGPYETVTISGWQTSQVQARRFYFTTEDGSYATWLGKTNDMGVISAVFYREKYAEPLPTTAQELPAPRRQADSARDRAGADPPSASAAVPQEKDEARNEYAATGIGRQTTHRVEQVWLDLEPAPAAVVNLRYEYRAQLVKLGVVPDRRPADRLSRRERARGFEPGFCPVP